MWLEHDDRLLLQQRPDSGVWAGLYSLPEFESHDALHSTIAPWQPQATALPSLRHVLTHFDWLLHPVHVRLSDPPPATLPVLPGQWVAYRDLPSLGLPAALVKLLRTHRG